MDPPRCVEHECANRPHDNQGDADKKSKVHVHTAAVPLEND